MSREYFSGGFFGYAGGYVSTAEDREFFLPHGYLSNRFIPEATGDGALASQDSAVSGADSVTALGARRYAPAVDFGLAYVKANANAIHLLPSGAYADRAAMLAASLGNKTTAAGNIFPGAIADASPNGRQITTLNVTDGIATANGTAAHWAVVSATEALIIADMGIARVVAADDGWTMGPTDIPFAATFYTAFSAGTGVLAASNAEIVSAGVSISVSTDGALPAQAATLSGTGTAITVESIGTGTLAASAATMAGEGTAGELEMRPWDLMDAIVIPRGYYNFSREDTLTGTPVTNVTNIGSQLSSDLTLFGASAPGRATANGKTVLDCAYNDGAGQSLRQTYNTSWGAGWVSTSSTVHTILVLSRYSTGGNQGRNLTGGVANWLCGHYLGNKGWYDGVAGWLYNSGAHGEVWDLMMGIADGANSSFWCNGEQLNGSPLTVAGGPGEIVIGGGGEPSDCQVFAVALYDYAVDTEHRQKIEGALLWDSGNQALLPVGHPYKDAPPQVAVVPATGVGVLQAQPIVLRGDSFKPSDLSGLLVWYDAMSGVYSDAGTTPATDSAVAKQWNDLSGHGYHLLAPDNTLSTYDTTGLNGHPTVRVQGEIFTTATDTVVQGGTDYMSTFVVGGMDASIGTWARLLSYIAEGYGIDYNDVPCACLLLNYSGLEAIGGYRAGGRAFSSISYNTSYRFGSIFDGTDHTIFVDNEASAPYAITGAFGNLGTIGIGLLGVWLGPVSEIVITNTALSALERDRLDFYFLAKWGESGAY